MEIFIEFVKNWGYWAVFGGSLIEGESVILTSCAMASQGYLNIYKVALIAFIGTTCADQALYFVGWYYGDAIFDRFPKIKVRAERAFRLLHKYDMAFIIACRFVYGVRITSPIVIGAAGIKPWRFIPLNILSAVIWTVISCTAGYLLGAVVFDFFSHVESFQKYIVYGVGGLIAAVIGAVKIKHYIRQRKNKA